MQPSSFRNEFDPTANVIGRLCLREGWVIAGNVAQDESDDLIVARTSGEVAAFASDLPEH